MKRIKRSELKYEISFTTDVQTADGLGGFITTQSTYYTTWAAIWPRSAEVLLQAEKPTHEITHRIRIRYPHGKTITSDMNIAFGSRTFEINGIINPEEANIYLDILATEQ